MTFRILTLRLPRYIFDKLDILADSVIKRKTAADYLVYYAV